MLSIAQAGRAISACREPVMNTFPVLLGALCIYALAYRFYSAFIAAKALSLDDRRTTPAHAYPDGHNYVASPRCPRRIRCGTALELTLNRAPAPQEAFGPPLTSAGEVKMGCC
jgi:hypothetical protein